MNLDVTVAGSTMTWRFRGSPRWERFLAQRPWENAGGTILLRLAAPEQAPTVMDLAHTSLYAASVRSDPPEILRTGLNNEPRTPSELICHALDRGADAEHRRIGKIADHCSDKPLVVLIDGCKAAGELASDPLANQCERLVSSVRKYPVSGRLAIVLLDTARAPLGIDPCDLTCGQPADSILDFQHAAAAQRWAVYVHIRMAWETGGHHSRCIDWAKGFESSQSIGKDEVLEKWLNQRAADGYAKLDPDLRDAITLYLNELARHDAGKERCEELAAILEQEELLAPPGAVGMPAPVPWVARAALQTVPGHPAAVFLRHCLVCQPIARDLLHRCFELEARLRARAAAAGPVGIMEITQTMRDRLDDFNNGRLRSSARFYPRAHPARPSDFLDFASLGEFNRLAGAQEREADNLMSLRNALSHGHYVCWESLRALAEAEDDLRDRPL